MLINDFKNMFRTALNLEGNNTNQMLSLLEEGKDSQAIVRVIADYSILVDNSAVFTACMRFVDRQTSEYLFSNDAKGKYWMIYRLLKKIETPSPKIMSNLLHNIMFDFKELDATTDDILSMQDCCAFIREQGMTFTRQYTHFLNTMSNLREKRRRRAIENMYWFVLQNVTCNPDHPIGKRRIEALARDFYTAGRAI